MFIVLSIEHGLCWVRELVARDAQSRERDDVQRRDEVKRQSKPSLIVISLEEAERALPTKLTVPQESRVLARVECQVL